MPVDMDRLRKCMDALRVSAKSSHADPFLEVEMRVNEFVKAEGGGRAPLEELLQAINVQGSDLSAMFSVILCLIER
jgi:hypothetical protein